MKANSSEEVAFRRRSPMFISLAGCTVVGVASAVSCVVLINSTLVTGVYAILLIAAVVAVFGWSVHSAWLFLCWMPVSFVVSESGMFVKCVVGGERWAWSDIESVQRVASKRETRLALLLHIPKRESPLQLSARIFGSDFARLEQEIGSRLKSAPASS